MGVQDPDQARREVQAAHLIELTNFCQAFHCLPGPGGLFDQDPYLMYGMAKVLEHQQTKSEREAEEAKRNASRPS